MEWKSRAETEAGKLVETGKSTLTGTIRKYTGIPEERIQETLASLSAWWQLNNPQEGSTDKLLKQLNSN